ncbi:hypothetical protein [Polaribacter sp. Asnod6-C07]|uniref:hypothetical protein n=1 Tax=Polaribacter sp. Asnod6-C07 TaxID=3160582 RepID=UPI00386C73E3
MRIKTKYTIAKTILVLAIVFNVALPKGGVAIANTPITWGYIIIFLVIGYSLIKGLSIKKINKLKAQAFICILPFIFYFIAYLFYVEEYPPIGYLFSAILNFVIFPIIFLLFFDKTLKYILKNNAFFSKIILRCILFLSLFGIFLFIYKIKTGVAFEIPYLTVNIKDYGLLNSKHNNRGNGIFKLVSTYANGNIFGLCMFFLLPFAKNHKNHKILLKIAMVLTLSRTVWAGLVIYEIISYRKHIVKMLYIGLVVLLTIFLFMVFVLDRDISYIFDPSLGGRLKGNGIALSLFFNGKVFYGISEMTYKDILEQMGLIGLLFFVLQVFTPVILSFQRGIENLNENQQQLRIGVLTYLIVAFIDGAYLYIPVCLFLWFSSSYIITSKITEDSK